MAGFWNKNQGCYLYLSLNLKCYQLSNTKMLQHLHFLLRRRSENVLKPFLFLLQMIWLPISALMGFLNHVTSSLAAGEQFFVLWEYELISAWGHLKRWVAVFLRCRDVPASALKKRTVKQMILTLQNAAYGRGLTIYNRKGATWDCHNVNRRFCFQEGFVSSDSTQRNYDGWCG